MRFELPAVNAGTEGGPVMLSMYRGDGFLVERGALPPTFEFLFTLTGTGDAAGCLGASFSESASEETGLGVDPALGGLPNLGL